MHSGVAVEKEKGIPISRPPNMIGFIPAMEQMHELRGTSIWNIIYYTYCSPMRHHPMGTPYGLGGCPRS